jgi:hypothetical protein
MKRVPASPPFPVFRTIYLTPLGQLRVAHARLVPSPQGEGDGRDCRLSHPADMARRTHLIKES